MSAIEAGRSAFARDAWAEAYATLSPLAGEGVLAGADLQRLATAAFLTGRDDEAHAVFERAHRALLEEGDVRGAARCAFWLGMLLLQRGQHAPGGGWIARAKRVLEDEPICAEHGFLLVPEGRMALARGDVEGSAEIFRQVGVIADECGDPDLAVASRLGLGDAFLAAGDVTAGLSLLDEVMVSVQAGDVSPILSGIAYCAVIGACQELHDVRRAQQWTEALTAWCAAQPDLVPFRGQCLVHRAEILRFRGRWEQAFDAALEAAERFSEPPTDPSIGGAYYEQAELHRLRGDLDAAEEAYRRASEWGHPPQPGLALLRLLQGDATAARAAIDRALDEETAPARRLRLLAASVEVYLAGGDHGAARAASEEVQRIAAGLDVPVLNATAAHVAGAVSLVDGDARSALSLLRRAWSLWRDLDAPYDAARARVLLGMACRDLGDDDGARLEFDAARKGFAELGARPELERLDELAPSRPGERPGGLTEREVEVLRLVADGRTNRAIAEELVISEHTVARHVQNIFTKIGVGSRTAAAAFAFEHGLV